MNGKLLTVKELLEELRRKGVNVSEPTLRRYIYKNFIPDSFVVRTKHGLVYRYKFKPEAV